MPSILEDKEAIRDLLFRYCYGTDAGNVEQWVAGFTDDCVWDGGPFGVCNGKAEMRAFYAKGVEQARTMRHLTLNTVIGVQVDRAHAVSYVALLQVAATGTNIMFTGFYDDSLVRLDGHWRISDRKLRPDLSEINLPG
jgi:hypothetical protein